MVNSTLTYITLTAIKSIKNTNIRSHNCQQQPEYIQEVFCRISNESQYVTRGTCIGQRICSFNLLSVVEAVYLNYNDCASMLITCIYLLPVVNL